MQFKAKRFELDEDGFGVTQAGEGLWILAQSGVTEGFVFELNAGDATTMTADERQEAIRQSNWQMIGLIRGWNFDDADGKPLPLPKDIKTEDFTDDVFDPDTDKLRLTAQQKYIAERNRILSSCPLPLFRFIAQNIVRGAQVPDRVEGFSRTDSGR